MGTLLNHKTHGTPYNLVNFGDTCKLRLLDDKSTSSVPFGTGPKCLRMSGTTRLQLREFQLSLGPCLPQTFIYHQVHVNLFNLGMYPIFIPHITNPLCTFVEFIDGSSLIPLGGYVPQVTFFPPISSSFYSSSVKLTSIWLRASQIQY